MLEADVAVRCVDVAGVNLELGPSGGNVGAALNATFEALGKRDKGSAAAGKLDGLEWMIEVGARSAVAVPVVVVKKSTPLPCGTD